MGDAVPIFFSLLPITAAAVGWYFAARLATFALCGGHDTPLRRGAAQVMPVAILVLFAIARHQPQIAVGVIFGSCVAMMSLVLGVVTFTAPPGSIASEPRRKWRWMLPAIVLVLLAGFQSQFTWLHAAVLAIEGIAVALVWTETPGLVHAASIHLSESEANRSEYSTPWLVGVAIALSIVAAWVAVSGSAKLLERSTLPSMSIIAAMLLGPATVISMIGPSCSLAQRGHYAHAVGSHVAFVMLSLCLILPMVILAWHVDQAVHVHGFGDAMHALTGGDDGLMYPVLVWRVDSVMLLVLGVALLSMTMGRSAPGRAEGATLVALYVVYLILWRLGSAIG